MLLTEPEAPDAFTEVVEDPDEVLEALTLEPETLVIEPAVTVTGRKVISL